MNPIKISITFLLAKSRVNQSGRCPIRCRITYKKIRYEFATGFFINPNHWNSKQQIAKPPNEENTFTNNELSLIKNKINQAFLLLQIQGNDFNTDDIYNQYKGKPNTENIGIVSHYNDYLNRYHKLIGIEIKQITWNKFNYILNDLKNFIKHKYNLKDVLLKDLDYSFITEFEYYLKTEKLQKQVTINKALQRFKKVVKVAVTNKLIDDYPFSEHKPKRVIKSVIFLTAEELSLIENHVFSHKRMETIRDMFIFCCYTGLPYNEMSKLENKHLENGFDGLKWIKMIRDKTSKEISIPLLPTATCILNKYQSHSPRTNRLLPIVSNQKFNSYLKEIAQIVGIDKNLTHHTARKTFASTVLLYNDVPMEIVSELLGHSNMIITQESYGKVIQSKISEHIKTLAKKLK